MKLTSIALRLFVQIKEAAKKKVFGGDRPLKRVEGRPNRKSIFL